MNKFLFIVIILLNGFFGFSQQVKTPPIHVQSQIRFTENKNQWDKSISHRAQLDGGALFIEKSGKLTYHLYDKDNYRARHLGKSLSDELKLHTYTVDFIGSNSAPVILSNDRTEDYTNFFLGKDRKNWASNVGNYKAITVKNLYHNIDVIYYGGHQSIKYNFIVKPNANPHDIKIHYTGVNEIKLKNDELCISTSVSESIEQKPFVFQVINGDTIEIPCKFILRDNVVSFKLLKKYDHSKELIIDPLLVFAAQSGSTADNFGMTATYDERGNLYSGGTAFNVGFPTTVGAYDVTYNGNVIDGYTDVVITKYDSSGTFLQYSTYLGGATSSEIVTSLVVDTTNNLCLYGATGSTDFPTTTGCIDSTFNGGQFLHYPQNGTLFNGGTDIYVAKFNSFGTNLLASTYLGGSQNDGVNNNINTSLYDSLMFNYGDQFRGEIQVNKNNEIYIVSSSKSPNFPMVNAIDSSLNGNQDAVLLKLNSSLTSIIFSTFIGGSNKDCGNSLTLDDSLNIYITGGTCSSDFYTTAGSYKPVYSGGKTDGYICKIKYDGSVVMRSTFIGTTNYDQSYFVQLDNNRDVYVLGQTQGSMPVTAGVYFKANSKQFIQKLDSQLDTLLASTVIGNSNGQINISPSAFSVDCAGNIYFSGWGGKIVAPTSLTFNMPLTPNAIQSTTDGHNFYIMVLGPNMTSLVFASYFGGGQSWEHVDGGTSRFDKKGIIYQSVCAGCQTSSGVTNQDFPVTPGAWPGTPGTPNHNTDNNNCNNGVFKIDFQLNSATASISTNTISGCVPLTVNFSNNSTPGHQYLWDFGTNDTTSIIFNPIKTYTAAGTYTVALYVKTSICTNEYDTANITITVYPKPVSVFTSTWAPCTNTISTTNGSSGNFGPAPYAWDFGDSSPTSTLTSPAHTYTANGSYTVSLTVTSVNGCIAKATETVTVFNFVPAVTSGTICLGASKTLTATGGTTYTWQPSSTISNSTIATPVVTPTVNTIYTVNIDNNSPGYLCSKTLTTQVVVNPNNIAGFTFTSNPCSDTVKFINTSTTTAPTHTITWNFGGGLPTSTNTAVTQIYNNGSYSVTLLVVNNFGCRDSITNSFAVYNFTPGVSFGDTICRGFTSSVNATGGTSYTWSPSVAVSNPFVSSPITTPSVTTIYTVNIVDNTPGYTCTKTLTTTVLVYPKINTSFTYTIGACSNNVQFTDGSVSNPVNWQWDFGDTHGSGSQNPLYYYSVTGTYTTTLISTNNFGCKDTSLQVIALPPFSPISINSAILKCESDTVQLNATGGTLYSWQPSQTLSNSTIANPLAFPLTTTIYTVTISTLNGSVTCNSILTTTVNITPLGYNTSSITVNPSTITLGQSSNVTLNGFPPGNTVTVVPDAHVTFTGSDSFSVTPTKSGEYIIYATSPDNCRHYLKTIYVVVVADNCNEHVVYLPTGFTPNNDGVNDILYIRSNFITDVYLTIYDRWGEKLFETNDVNKGWDGTFKGKLLDQGVYGYYMTFTCNNGEQSFKKGNITLMR